MRTALRKMGNSAGMIVPKPLLAELGSGIGEAFELSVENGRLVAAPVRTHPRAGWADAAQALTEADEDALTWPELANDEDEGLAW